MIRWLLLGIAWMMMLTSMLGPAIPVPFFLAGPYTYTPVCALLALAASACTGGPGTPGPHIAMLPALGCFLLTPALLALRPRSIAGRSLRWVFMMGLLTVWAVPLIMYIFMSPFDRFQSGFKYLMWGYWLFAAAHTLAFIACVLGPPGLPKGSSKIGFPVILHSSSSAEAETPAAASDDG